MFALVGRMNVESLTRVEELEELLAESEKKLETATHTLSSLEQALIERLRSLKPDLLEGQSVESVAFMQNGMVMVSCRESVGARFFKLEFALKKS